jgi:serine phosphatase RsbU (regulator of sigma subunit)
MAPARATIFRELRVPFLVLVTVLPVLAFSGWRVYGSIAEASRYQSNIRIAQIDRARVLRYQLDEETGVRGYVATGDPSYLQPYTRSQAKMESAYERLLNVLATLNMADLEAIAQQERRRNELWNSTIGRTLIADPTRSATSLEVQRRGKTLTDAVRSDDLKLFTRLDAAATAADRRSQRALESTFAYVVSALTVITLSLGAFAYLQARTSRRAFENLVLYETQKRIADGLQTAFLNKDLPVSLNVGLHATYIPASLEAQVGGDWYDAFELPDKRILFSIGDVAGHGLEAAVVMSRARQAIIAAALHENDPAKVLERANESILLQDPRMVTAICGYIDPRTLEVVYATAGHPSPILARPNRPAVFLPHDGIPLGIVPNATYRTFVERASDGDVMILYTDGVIEHKRDIIDGEARLLAAARAAVLDENPAIAIRQQIFQRNVPKDDVAILTVKFKAATDELEGAASISGLQSNRLELPATRER